MLNIFDLTPALMWPFSAAAPAVCPMPDSRHPTGLSPDRVVSSIPRWLPSDSPEGCPVPASASTDATACPARSAAVPSAAGSSTLPPTVGGAPADAAPKAKDENWVYPSPLSFYTALERKDRNPQAPDMPIVVPIHNAVNERVWEQVLQWEREAGGEGSRLVNFVGRPKDPSLRARWNGLIGYSAPFDRHDWIVDRPLPNAPPGEPTSLRIRYICDFYTGRLPALLAPDRGAEKGGSEEMFRPNLAFYLDVRPAVDGVEPAMMRAGRFWRKVSGAKAQGQQV